MNIQTLYVCVLLITAAYTPAWASPAGEMSLFVEIKEKNKAHSWHIPEPDWYIAPGNTHTEKTLERAMLKRCLKAFNLKTKKGLDHVVTYEEHFCNTREGIGDRIISVKLAAPSKIFLEAFHEFSMLWHELRPKKSWRLCTNKALAYQTQVNDGSNIKRYVKLSRCKKYVFLYEYGDGYTDSTDDAHTVVSLTIFQKKAKGESFFLGEISTAKKV